MEKQRNSNCWYLKVCDDDCTNCITYIQMKWQMENSGLPAKLQRPIDLYLTSDNECDKEAFYRLATIKKDIVNYVAEGKNLFICGRSGNGKTSWAIKLLQSYLHHMAPGHYESLQGMFISTANLLLKLKDFNNPVTAAYKRNIEQVPLVIWDDICVTGMSQYDYSQLFSFLNTRTLAGLSNIFTSNVSDRTELLQVFGERLVSRVYNTSEIIELKGLDMR